MPRSSTARTRLGRARQSAPRARGRRAALLVPSLLLAACLPYAPQHITRAQATPPAAARGQRPGVKLTVMREAAPEKLDPVSALDAPLRNFTDAEGNRFSSAAGKLVFSTPPGGNVFIQIENLTGGNLYLRLYSKDASGTVDEESLADISREEGNAFRAGPAAGRGYLLPAGRVYRTRTFAPEQGFAGMTLILLGSPAPIRFGLVGDKISAGGATRANAAPVEQPLPPTAANVSAFFGLAGSYEIAVELYEYLLGRAVAERREDEATNLRNALGLAHHSASRYDKAFEYYGQALADVRRRGDREGESVVLSNLGLVYSTIGRYAEAVEHFNRSLAVERALRRPSREAVTLSNLAMTYVAMGKTAESIAESERALALQRRLGNSVGVGKALGGLGSAYRVLCQQALRGAAGRPAQHAGAQVTAPPPCRRAAELHAEAFGIAREVGNRNDEGFALNNLGSVYSLLGDYVRAAVHYRRALDIYREVGNRAAEGLALNNLMLSLRALGQPGLAAVTGKRAVNLYQQLRGEMQGLEAASQRSFLESKSVTYRALADLLIELGRLPEAQQVIGMLKEEEYFEFVRRDGGEAASLSSRAAVSPAEEELERRYLEIAGRLVAEGRERGALRERANLSAAEEQRLAQLDADIELAGRAFQQFLDQLARERRAGAADEKLFELREAQGLMETLRELGSGAVALYTIVGAEKYRVILITPDVQKAAEYPIGEAELNGKIAALREAVQNPRRDPRPVAQELYKILVGPIAKDLEGAGAETLMWSLDGALRYVPMAALHDGRQYLVERYRTAVFTPASRDRLKDQPGALWRGLGFGVSKAHAGFRPLASVPEELSAVISDESGDAPAGGVLPGRVLLDEAFTVDAMRAALRARYPVVHIASHFAFRPGNESDSFLLLGDGGRLSLAQLKATTNLFSGVELLTLSACDTATGGAGADGREVEGFAVLAQRQGAKAVLATLWPVADKSTNHLMQQFYRARGEQPGTPKVEALRQAQLSLLRGDGGRATGPAQKPPGGLGAALPGSFAPDPRAPYAHPYFWAPFILIGNWR